MACTTAAFAQDKTNEEYPAHTLDEAVALAAQHKTGANVTVEFPVANFAFIKQGPDDTHVFLDSMKNYRDPRSVNVDVFPHAAHRLNLTPDANPIGKTLTVHGIAKLVAIKCMTKCPKEAMADDYRSPTAREAGYALRGQKPIADYYFQTHILVRDPDDAQISDSTGQ